MIEEYSAIFTKQVKELAKEFKFMDRSYIRILFQFCDFEPLRTYKVLKILKDSNNPLAIIKKLVDNPNITDKILFEYEERYRDKFGEEDIKLWWMENQKVEQEEQKDKLDINKPQNDFFQEIPSDLCIQIASFLDPISFSQFSQANKFLFKLSHSQLHQEYFKKLNLCLFQSIIPKLPESCTFQQVRNYVLSNPIQFGPNSRNAVCNDLSYYVWKMDPKSLKLEKDYYLSFGNHRNLFMQCPRIHFNGFYTCKHRYVKIGEKDYRNSITPIHVISYFKYFRFFQDGTLLYNISTKKVKKQKISETLSRQNFLNYEPSDQNTLLVGEHMQYKNKIYAKIVKSNTIFSYEFEICSNEGRISNELMVLNYSLEMVDENQITQNLYRYKPNKQKMIFTYESSSRLKGENSIKVQVCGL